MIRRALRVPLLAGLVVAFVVAALPAAIGGQAGTPSLESKVDAVFSRWSTTTPGCTVGVSVDGKAVLQKAYGMADLEHDAINTADTIIEVGSVSKQFTAAAVLLLARDGKLSLDDPARKYVPELPEYGVPLTVRHMLQHTSGLRDWGSVAGLTGWPRTTRAYTHAHVLDIVSRQRSLNFDPGTQWSYSNTGYNLAAIIVSRVSGQTFAEFTRTRIFEPLGMTRTSWRDDHTRVVKGRAIAYSEARGAFSIQMPFENVHGNGGLLTTVGDLLRWNQNFVEASVGGADFVQEQQQPGRFSDGRAHEYGFGLFAGEYKSVREVYHGGSTAGYRAFLTRFPDQAVSVAVLCNVSSGTAERYAHAVADLYLGDRVKPPVPPVPAAVSPEDTAARTGLYRNLTTGEPLAIARAESGLRIEGGAILVPESATSFTAPDRSRRFEFTEGSTLRVLARNGTVEMYARVAPVSPTPAQLAEYAGTYASDEAEAVMTAMVEGSELKLKRRPDASFTLRPLYADAFAGPVGTVIFRRDAKGRVTEFSVAQDRVWDLRFRRQAGTPPSSPR